MTTRRSILLGGAAAVASAALPRAAYGATRGGAAHPDVRDDGTYATVDLAKPAWTLGVVQSRVRSFDAGVARTSMRENLAHMLELIDKAFYYGPRPDLLFFHEFPLTGWRRWTRKEILRFAIEIPGPETEAIARKAREYGVWIVFGAYAKDSDWPGHVLSITTLIDDQGRIVDKHWKARNVKGVFPGFELFTTTIYDVLDRYVEMYGRDAVIPVTRTPLGNLATSSIQREPELFRAMAMKGAEVILRTASGGFSPMDIAATSFYNGTYTAIVNNSVSPNNGLFFEDAGSGGSAVYGPDGKVIAEANGKEEQLVSARIPIAELRARKRQPDVHMDLYRDIFNAYASRFPPNLWLERIPDSLEDAATLLAGKTRWR